MSVQHGSGTAELNVSSGVQDLDAIITRFSQAVQQKTDAFQQDMETLAQEAIADAKRIVAKEPLLDMGEDD